MTNEPDIWAAFLAETPLETETLGFDESFSPVPAVVSAPTASPTQTLEAAPIRSDTVDQLCEMLAEVLGCDSVSADSNFFDDLGADSLLMAAFCARARSRTDIPAPSIREVYGNPSIASLVAHFSPGAESTAVPELAIDRHEPDHISATPASRFMYVLVGTLQAAVLLAMTTAAGYTAATGLSWMSAADGAWNTYQRSVVFGFLFFVGWALVPVAAKWLLVGRWKRERLALWSLRHFRFWLVTTLVKFNPMVLFAGSPVFLYWLRALGADIGKGVVYLSRQVPVCTDQLTIADGAVVRADAIIKCYRAVDGYIEIGPVSLGTGSFVGVGSILDIDTTLGERSQLGHASTVIAGQHIPDDVHVVGTPARQFTDVDFADVEHKTHPAVNRVAYSSLQLALVFLVSLPFSTLAPLVLFRLPFSPTSTTSSSIVLSLLLFSAFVYVGGILLAFAVAMITTRVFAGVFEPGVAYPLYGPRYAIHRFVNRVTNVPFLTKLLGDSSYILHYVYALGYGVKLTDQTGANFGTGVKHDSPYYVHVGGGTMVADGITFANSKFSNTSFQLGSVTLAEHSYFGNNIVYPPQGKTSSNCLVGTKTLIPLDGPAREDVGLLGSPSFEIPRIVERDLEFDHYRHGERFRDRLAGKDRHNRHSIAIFVLTRFVATTVALAFVTLGISLFNEVGILLSAVILPTAIAVGWLYNIAIERAIGWLQPIRPTICSMYEIESWRVERFWKLNWSPVALNGTAMKGTAWKLLGVDIGKQVFDDGCAMTERTLMSVGDYCTLNSGTVLQSHSQEDAAFKADRVTIGRHCTLGTGSFVHYGTHIGDGARLETNAFIMKGTAVPAGTWWGENPARDVGSDSANQLEASAPQNDDEPTRIATDHQSNQYNDAEGEPAVTADPLPIPDLQSWRLTVDRAGLTAVPCLTADPCEGSGHVETMLEHTLASSITSTAVSLGVSPQTLFLAAHAKVVAALTGETDLTIGYAPTAGVALPLVLDLTGPTWRALIEQSDAHSITIDAHHEEALAELDAAGFPDSLFETVFRSFETKFRSARSADAYQLQAGANLVVSPRGSGGQFALGAEHRLDTVDAPAAERIIGYHLRALEHLVADVDSDHRCARLLSEAEVRYQLEDLAGPTRELPDLRFHEIFEQRVRDHPNKVAATYNGAELTYEELNAQANQLARALLARKAKPETVVGVVTERNLDWMASVIAIFKIGAAYMPIEPHFPGDRIASMLDRSNCRLVIAEEGRTQTLYDAMRAIPRVTGFFAATAYAEGQSDHNLDIPVHPDQLAYIYFTSGSTGMPKGAMCEHLGMLNHLFAKIDDFTIAEGDVVAQIAPQCFDISLWQLVSALLVGGRTVLIDQETLLDPERLIKEVVRQEIGVLQVVPSYLEVLLSHLEANPTQLGGLHCVSVTGEALSIELAERWFQSLPEIKLANAYGLTETSDDTNHEVMAVAPTNGRVPLGRAVNNVSVRVVDPSLSLVPFGAPGEIVFSGICVGRGYINDPERTAAAFVDDPSTRGERLYRSGDFGRWDAHGKLEFLGRRDAQVKIRGFRIEIGDIENALLRVGGVRQGAVVITSRGDGVKQLVAFYSGGRFQPKHVRQELEAALPDYMVPAAIHHEDNLPLSDNGKIDRKALRSLAVDREVIDLDFAPPETATETRLSEIWAELLDIPVEQIGRMDHFFERGANSLSAVELVTKLDRVVSLRDVTSNPVLAHLAALIDDATDAAGPEHHLLQMLTTIDCAHNQPLICFPYAGGNAINYQAMASALKNTAFSVYAVDLPGHDLGSTHELFESLDVVVGQVVEEIVAKGLSDIVLWGHSSGSAFALAAAERLAAEEVSVEKVFIGAQVPGSVESRELHSASLAGRSDVEIARTLAEDGGYSELGQLSDDQSAFIGAAYRHDVNEADRWFIKRLGAAAPTKLDTPVVAVLADDDPSLTTSESEPEDWAILVDDLDVVHLPCGGHYFLRTHPAEAARAILAYTAETSVLAEKV